MTYRYTSFEISTELRNQRCIHLNLCNLKIDFYTLFNLKFLNETSHFEIVEMVYYDTTSTGSNSKLMPKRLKDSDDSDAYKFIFPSH